MINESHTFTEHVYPNKLKNRNFDCAKTLESNDLKSFHISNIERLKVVQSQRLLCDAKPDFSVCLGITLCPLHLGALAVRVEISYRLEKKLRQKKCILNSITEKLRLFIEKAVFSYLKHLFADKRTFLFQLIFPPRSLKVPQLPFPPFRIHLPPRFFWRPLGRAQKKSMCFYENLILEANEEQPKLVDQSTELISLAKDKLLSKGVLRKDHKGFVYLDVPDAYIHLLSPLLGKECEKPPYFSYDGPFGAHIPVLLPSEYAERKGLRPIQELGLEFNFSLENCYTVVTQAWEGVEKVWFLNVRCQPLENLRERYLLPSKIYNYDFHLVIGIKRQPNDLGIALPKQTYRINVSCYAA